MIKSRYSEKTIDPNLYQTIKFDGDINGNGNTNGIVYVPYVLKEHTKESLKEHKKFKKQYHKNHECCPKCGSKEHSTTLMGYPLIKGKENEYKNLNTCRCLNCKDIHITHSRIPRISFIDRLLGKN